MAHFRARPHAMPAPIAQHTLLLCYRAVFALLLLLPAACMTPVGPVEVTRFHNLGQSIFGGRASFVTKPGDAHDGTSIEYRSYANAVASELSGLGLAERGVTADDGASADIVALVSFRRGVRGGSNRRGPITVGGGASTGSFGSGVGLGVGINLGGSGETITSELGVQLRDARTNTVIWEGRAQAEGRAGSASAQTQLSAGKLAEALFQGFPGESGRTIAVP